MSIFSSFILRRFMSEIQIIMSLLRHDYKFTITYF